MGVCAWTSQAQAVSAGSLLMHAWCACVFGCGVQALPPPSVLACRVRALLGATTRVAASAGGNPLPALWQVLLTHAQGADSGAACRGLGPAWHHQSPPAPPWHRACIIRAPRPAL